MRIWDIEPKYLCRNHLLGEHRELHAIWSILYNGKKGYARHPETKRWVGKTRALYLRHEKLVKEMEKRGYRHRSPLSNEVVSGAKTQNKYINTKKEQIEILKNKKCSCFTSLKQSE